MTHPMHLVCPNSPSVWDRNQLSECFDDMVLGFGVNVVTIIIISIFVITKRGRRRSKVDFIEKVSSKLLPVFGLCLSLLSLMFLVDKALKRNDIPYHEWYFICSRFAVWMFIILYSRCTYGHFIFCNWLVGGWWLARSVVGGLHLLRTIFSSEIQVLISLNESSLVLLDIMFGIIINITWIKLASCKTRSSSSIEDPLLPVDINIEESQAVNSGPGLSCWDSVAFDSISSVMNRGMTKQLEFEDLLEMPSEMDPPSCHDILLSCWKAQQSNNPSNPSLLRAICGAYGWPYFRLGFLKIFNDCICFAGPLLLNKLIQFLQQGSGGLDGYILAGSLGITSILKSFLDTQYSFRLSKLKLKLRSGIMTTIYQKCLCVSLAERSQFSEGEIQTFMSVDADRTVNMCNSFHDIWSLPLQIGVAFYLLYTQVKFAFISGVALTILLIPVNKWIATLIANATGKMMKQKDERIRRTGELLTHIRTLKMYGWELLFSSWLMETRSSEVKSLSTRKYLDAWCVFFWATTPTLFSLFTFGLYTMMGHQLDAATVFTCLALFNSLISPLNSFPWVINGLIDAIISSRRLSRFLSCSEQKRNLGSTSKSPITFAKTNQASYEDMAVVMHEACCAWSDSNENRHVLNHVTLSLPRGSFITVVGEVGSGKSSLLNALLGEMHVAHGLVYSSGSLAYVPQVPWIQSGTVRDNILFGKSYDVKRYSDTLKACALDVDISLMNGGDMAYIGDKGINLSGGQRARLALARAVYCGLDIYVLDDVLSAVDSQVASCILHTAILGPLMVNKTRVLCTHNIQAISSADLVVVMDKGNVKWVGSVADFKLSNYSAILSLNEAIISCQVGNQDCILSTCSSPMEQNDVLISEGVQELVELESRKEGRVELIIYKKYAAFVGWFITIVICLSAILMQASRNGNDLWLSYWVDSTNRTMEQSTSIYLLILCLFCLMNSLFTLVRSFSFAYGGLRAAVRVHSTLLNKLIDAPVHFYDKTPRGRILNRLSSDLYTIDDSLPFILNILLANFVGLLGIAIILSYVQVFFLLLLFPFWYIYSKLQFFYRSTSRELRRLDSVSRSPIYTSFTETLDGSSTIRAFNSEEHFFTKFINYVALYQQTSYSEITASLWLSLRLQLLGAFIISFVAILSVIGSQGSLPISLGTPGLVGLALSYASPIVSLLGSFLTSFTETEKEMVSMERALEYMDIPQEQNHGREILASDWPFQGRIEFQSVTMRYMPSLPPALQDVTFTVAGGNQVGIVGRTGAGKSSVLNALFRLHPICNGRILVDSIDIKDIPVRDLRSHLAIVPQSPFLFEGSLRDNLDPFGGSTDLKIWSALEKCHIKEEIETAGGLDVRVKESGTSFSVGQRQLLCLARALLKSSKLLCLDECTASIDTQTASVLQNTISNECKGMTVITIAHRISTVFTMDNILVLDRGMLVEEGHPQALLQDQFSRFSNFAKASRM